MAGVALERDVLHDVMDHLEILQKVSKCVVWFERLNSGKVRTEYGSWIQLCRKGTPDVIALVNSGEGIHVVFIECKRPGGKQETQQRTFQDRISGYRQIHYLIVDDVKQLKLYLSDLTTKHTQQQLLKITLD